jgi:hypothetical protein
VVASFAALWLAGPAFVAGLADPHESARCDLARRVAVHLFGADLARPGDPQGIPTLGDLAAGELPTTAMALSFSLFGYHDWAARVPALLFGVVAVWAVYDALSLTSGPRAATVGSVALLAMPLFFLHARSVAGDGLVMTGQALVVAGGVRLMLGRAPALGAALAGLGLVVAVHSRGLGVVVAPLFALGVSGWVARRSARRFLPPLALALGALALFVGAAHAASPQEDYRLLGLRLAAPRAADRTFDQVVRHLGHAAFPLSGFVPLALAAQARARDGEIETERFGRCLWVVGVVSSAGAHLWLTSLAGPLPFFGVVFVAGLLADFVASLGRRVSLVGAIVTVLAVALLGVDCARDPSRLFTALSWRPTSLASEGSVVALVSATMGLTAWATLAGPWEKPPNADSGLAAWLRRRAHAAHHALRLVQTYGDGRLLFTLALLEATLVGVAGMIALGSRAGWSPVTRLPVVVGKTAASAWWALPLAALGAWSALALAGDALALARRWVSRATLFSLGASIAASVLGFAYFPAALSSESPRPAVLAFESARRPGDALGVLGVSRAAVGLHSDVAPVVLDAPAAGFTFLTREPAGGSPARFLLADRRSLPGLNHLWRAERAQNLPVLGLWDGHVLAAASSERAGPFDAWLSSDVPTLAHESAVVFDDTIEIVGWQVESASGKVVDSLVPGVLYSLKVALVTRGRLRDEWEIFTHLERGSERRAFDHAFREGAYPMRYWLPGDVLVDEVEIVVPEDLPRGELTLFFGFFRGKERLPVSRGDATGDRARLGKLRVL